MTNILKVSNLLNALVGINPECKPQFGMMTPHHMVEHLTLFFCFSNGKKPQRHYFTTEQERMIKELVLEKKSMPIGFKSPALQEEGLPALKHLTFEVALEQMMAEFIDFKIYFEENPTAMPVNPALGELNYNEWLTFHECHIIHHLKQFNII